MQELDLSQHAQLRLTLLSDTHAWLHPQIAATVADSDVVVHAGDICSAGILDALQPRSGRIVAVAGNNDRPGRWPAEETQRVAALPRRVRLRLPGGVLAIEHGEEHGFARPDHGSLRLAHPRARMIAYGHTHRRVFDDSADPWVVNPGAAGRTRTIGGPSCAVLEASGEHWSLAFRVFEPLD